MRWKGDRTKKLSKQVIFIFNLIYVIIKQHLFLSNKNNRISAKIVP